MAQRIEPDFFAGIRTDAGNGDVEREAFDVASYGRQLGLITEVLLSMSGQDTVSRAKGQESLERLRQIHDRVEGIKRRHRASELDAARLALQKLRNSDPAALALLLAEHTPGRSLQT